MTATSANDGVPAVGLDLSAEEQPPDDIVATARQADEAGFACSNAARTESV
jgi:hypothetical protein